MVQLDGENGIPKTQAGPLFLRQQDAALADMTLTEGGALAVEDDGQWDRFARRDDEFLCAGAKRLLIQRVAEQRQRQ